MLIVQLETHKGQPISPSPFHYPTEDLLVGYMHEFWLENGIFPVFEIAHGCIHGKHSDMVCPGDERMLKIYETTRIFS